MATGGKKRGKGRAKAGGAKHKAKGGKAGRAGKAKAKAGKAARRSKARPRAADRPLTTPPPRVVRIGSVQGPSVRDLQVAALPTTIDGWKKLISGVISELIEVSGADTHPGTPAAASQLTAYEEFLTHELPPSYRAFLELHDGYRGLNLGGDFLSTSDAMPGGRFYRRILGWKKDCARYGAYEVLDSIVVADTQNTTDWVFIDPNHVSNGSERLVVKWSPSFDTKYPDIVAYLQSRIELCRASLREEKLA